MAYKHVKTYMGTCGCIARLPILSLLTLMASCVFGQTLEYTTHTSCIGDVVKKQTEHLNPGRGGTNCLWDFSNIDISGTVIRETNNIDSLGRIMITDSRQITYYRMRGDSLLEIGNETPLKVTAYNKPICSMKYPMTLGDSISKVFEGYGVYCGDHYFKEMGISTVVVDGQGDIILSETDTMKNVLRVYKLKSYSIAMDIKPSKIDSVQLKQIIEEKYEWYAKGYERPVFESVTSTSYADLSPLGTTQYSYCNIPELLSSDNDECLSGNDDGQSYDDMGGTSQDIIHYSVFVNGNHVDVDYSLDKKANVTMLISSHMGMIYQCIRQTQDAGTGYNVNFDIGSLPPGVYVLYINVNGKVYHEKISK